MIGLVKGKIVLRDGNYIIVDTGSVGYRVLVSSKVVNLGKDDISLFTYTHVREDSLDLFGFLETQDLKLFELLISVSGVGPKTAMSIFSFADRSGVVDAILKGDVSFFTQVPRLGKKNAQKIIIELKNKLGDDSMLDLSVVDSEENNEVLEALKSFGFSHKEIIEALKNIDKDIKTADEKIKFVLKYLGK